MLRSLLRVALITAAVTFSVEGSSGTPAVEDVPPAGPYKVFVIGVYGADDQTPVEWTLRTFKDKAECQMAIGNLNELLRVAVEPAAQDTPETKVAPDLLEEVGQLWLFIYQNTGVIPLLAVVCGVRVDAL